VAQQLADGKTVWLGNIIALRTGSQDKVKLGNRATLLNVGTDAIKLSQPKDDLNVEVIDSDGDLLMGNTPAKQAFMGKVTLREGVQPQTQGMLHKDCSFVVLLL